ncbi:MAG: PKD domain-containing protein [Dehalococcoidales bacterium]|jgi:PKD repeat protein
MAFNADFDVYPSTTIYVNDRIRFTSTSTLDHEYDFDKFIVGYGSTSSPLINAVGFTVRDNGNIYFIKPGFIIIDRYDVSTGTLTEKAGYIFPFDISLSIDENTVFLSEDNGYFNAINVDTLETTYAYHIYNYQGHPSGHWINSNNNLITTTVTGNIWYGLKASNQYSSPTTLLWCGSADGGITTTLYETGSIGTSESQILFIEDLATDSNDNLYVIDSGNDKILKYDYDGTFATAIFPTFTPSSIAIDWASDTIYLLDETDKRIYVCNEFGTVTNAWDLYYTFQDADYIFTATSFTDIAIHRSTGKLYVYSDIGIILIFNEDGTLYGTVNEPPDIKTVVNMVNGMAVNTLNHLHICDEYNYRIMVMDLANDTYMRSVYPLYRPQDVTFDSLNNMYVIFLDSTTIHLRKYDSDYNQLWDTTETNMIFDPDYDKIGVCCYDNYVYVSGSDRQYVHKFTSDGVFVAKYILPDTGRISVDTNGNFYICGHNDNTVKVYNNNFIQTYIISIATQPIAIYVDRNNYIYVTRYRAGYLEVFNSSGSEISSFSLKYVLYGKGVTTDINGNIISGEGSTGVQRWNLLTDISEAINYWWLFANIYTSRRSDYVDTWYNNIPNKGYVNVALDISTSLGHSSGIKSIPITILEKPNKVTFVNTTSETADEFFWDFGDGSVADTETVSHTYEYPGTYTATLYASNQDNYGEFSTTLIVPIPTPFAVFEIVAPDGYTVPTRLEFVPIIAVDGTREEEFDSILWTIDGVVYDELYPKVPFIVGGNKTISVQVKNNFGVYSLPYSRTISLYDSNVQVNFKPSYLNIVNSTFPTTVEFTNLSFDTLGDATYFWNFGDSTTSYDENPLHEYATFGNFTVSLTVSDTSGNNATKTYTNCINIMQKTMHISNTVDSYEFSTTSGFEVRAFDEFASNTDTVIHAHIITENVTFIQEETPSEAGLDEVGIRSYYIQVNEIGQRIYNSLTEFGRRVIKYPVMLKSTGFSFIRTKVIKEGVNAEDDFKKQ